MGYWENTTYVNCPAPSRVVDALTSLFAREGMTTTEAPPIRARHDFEPMQYAPALQNDCWGVCAFSASSDWTVIKTAPLELLGEKPSDSKQNRLSALCRQLANRGFQVNVYDGTAALLCEVSETGESYLSGFNLSGDPMTWYGDPLNEEFLIARFRHLPFQTVVENCEVPEDFARALAQHFGGGLAKHCDNRTSVEALVTHDHPKIQGARFAYFKWTGASREPIGSCSWQEWRMRQFRNTDDPLETHP